MFHKKASSIIEYVLIIGVVALALSMMNIYIKRGVQGKVKDMADFFISEGKPVQVTDANPEVESTSSSETVVSSDMHMDTSRGGGRRLWSLLESTDIDVIGKTIDTKKIIVPDATVTAGQGIVPVVTTSDYNKIRQQVDNQASNVAWQQSRTQFNTGN